MSEATNRDFFIGHSATAASAGFALRIAAAMLVGAFLLALGLGYSVQERGGGGYGEDMTARGVLENMPYPILRIPAADGKPARAILVAGDGKIGIGEAVTNFKGQLVEATGNMLKRGDLDMMILDPAGSAKPVAGASAPSLAAPVSLGRYRLAGEICDGKCYAGAMRPGTGIAHKACANLCILGGQPAVLATYKPVEGANFILLANADGSLPPNTMYDHVAVPVELEGELIRLDDLLIFRADWSKIKTQ